MMEIGIQLSSLAPLLNTAGNVDECIRRLCGTGYRYTQLQWISPEVSAHEIGCSLRRWGMQSVGTQEKFDACADRLDDFMNMNLEAGSDDVCFSTIPERYFEINSFPAFLQEAERLLNLLARRRMKMSFHPTKGDFRRTEKGRACDRLFEAFPEIRVVPDINQLMRAGADPQEFIGKYAGRIDTVHFKDAEGFYDGAPLTPVGKGITDFESLLPCMQSSGVRYVLAEQETWKGDPFERMAESYRYLKEIIG